MFERFTGEARQVVVTAQEQARRRHHNYIGTEHLLLALVALPPDNAVRQTLAGLGVTPESVDVAVGRLVGAGQEHREGHIPFTPRAKKVLELSLREALALKVNHIGAEHLLLGILREGDGVAAQILLDDGRSADYIRAAVLGAVPATPRNPARTPATEQALSQAEQIAAGAPVGTHHLLESLAGQEEP